MAFAFMDIQKIKTEGQMTAKYNHNCRKIEIDNVIPELSHLNEDLIPLPVDQNGNELSYYDAFKKRINELPYYQDHNIRKNAVRGYEVLLTFSKDESINVDEWKKLSVKWLKDTFNVAPDKRNNVLHVAFHADETGNYHCHAFVVPIDEKGKLNACRFTDGSRALSDLQTSFSCAKSFSKFLFAVECVNSSSFSIVSFCFKMCSSASLIFFVALSSMSFKEAA